jgi:Holliday junction resolvase RusA-like endonuclease
MKMENWTPILDFFVPGTPKPQPRPRAFARRIGNKAVARVYNPTDAEGWKNFIAIAARDHLPASRLEGPISLDLDFYFERPGRLMGRKWPDGPIPHDSAPDRDNLEKAVMDCMTALGFWRDDGQVCDGRVRKFYTARGGIPGAQIRISIYSPPDQDIFGRPRTARKKSVESAPLFAGAQP